MAGTNGKPKFLRCNREDEVDDLKIRGTIYQLFPFQGITTASVTGTQWSQTVVNFSALTPNAITGPTVNDLFQVFSQSAPPVGGETGQLVLSNSDPVNSKVITLPAGWTPSTFTIPPDTNALIRYQLSSVNPIGFSILSVEALGAAAPANNTAVPSGTFGTNFALTPAQPYDVIVRNAANTMWVPSVSASTGGALPWSKMGGTILSPTSDILNVDDGALATYTRLQEIRNRTNQATLPDFKMLNLLSTASNFGARGAGTTDTMVHTSITTPPGIQPNSYFYRGTLIGGGDLFYVRTSGVTKVTLSAGPPVTNIAVDALGQICAAVSSVTMKENIINVSDTSYVDLIPVKEFNFIGDNVKQIGAVVEEMEPLIPVPLRPALINYHVNWAFTDEQGVFHPMTRDFTKPESINTQGVVFCLLKELQALRARVALLEAP